MLRSGFILGVSGPAALLTILVQPVIQREADLRSPPTAIVRSLSASTLTPVIPTIRPTETIKVSTARPAERSVPAISDEQKSAVNEKPALKPRRTMRDGCEGAISSLAGPEARRMIPGRCIA